MASTIHAVAHGLSAGDAFRFANLVPADAGPDEGTTYYVLAAGLGADDFEFSETDGGSPFTLTLEITDGSLIGPSNYVIDTSAASDIDLGPTTTENLLANPSFENWDGTVELPADPTSVIPGWAVSFFTNHGPEVRQTGAIHGSNYIHFADTFANYSLLVSNRFPAVAGAVYQGRFLAKGALTGSSVLYMAVEWFDAAGASISSAVVFSRLGAMGLTTSWVDYTTNVNDNSTGRVTAPALTAFAKITVGIDPLTNTSDYADVDWVRFLLVPSHVTNDGATVTIDGNGITIEDGALTLRDAYGSTVMEASGFSGTWQSFLLSGGIYNADFVAGSTSDIAVSEVSGGDTDDDYAASLSPDLPYWVVAASDGVLKKVVDTNVPGGFALESTATAGSQTNRWYQDVYVSSEDAFHLDCRVATARTSGSYDLRIWFSWRDITHAIIGSRAAVFAVAGVTAAGSITSYEFIDGFTADMGVARPAAAAYLRIELEVIHNSTSGQTVRISTLGLNEATPNYSQLSVEDFLDVDGELIVQGDTTVVGLTVDGDAVFGGDLVTLASGVLLHTGGASFPSSPAADDRYYRTDLGMEFFYDGTRWLSSQLFVGHCGAWAASATYAVVLSATQTFVGRGTLGDFGLSDIWLESVTTTDHIASGGTALSASHKWTMDLMKMDTASSGTSVGQVVYNSGSSNVIRRGRTAIGALLGTTATYPMMRVDWTKTGTPGNLTVSAPVLIRYRVVAT